MRVPHWLRHDYRCPHFIHLNFSNSLANNIWCASLRTEKIVDFRRAVGSLGYMVKENSWKLLDTVDQGSRMAAEQPAIPFRKPWSTKSRNFQDFSFTMYPQWRACIRRDWMPTARRESTHQKPPGNFQPQLARNPSRRRGRTNSKSANPDRPWSHACLGQLARDPSGLRSTVQRLNVNLIPKKHNSNLYYCIQLVGTLKTSSKWRRYLNTILLILNTTRNATLLMNFLKEISIFISSAKSAEWSCWRFRRPQPHSAALVDKINKFPIFQGVLHWRKRHLPIGSLGRPSPTRSYLSTYTLSHRECGQFRPYGAIESNCPSWIFQKFHEHRDGTAYTLDRTQYRNYLESFRWSSHQLKREISPQSHPNPTRANHQRIGQERDSTRSDCQCTLRNNDQKWNSLHLRPIINRNFISCLLQ